MSDCAFRLHRGKLDCIEFLASTCQKIDETVFTKALDPDEMQLRTLHCCSVRLCKIAELMRSKSTGISK